MFVGNNLISCNVVDRIGSFPFRSSISALVLLWEVLRSLDSFLMSSVPLALIAGARSPNSIGAATARALARKGLARDFLLVSSARSGSGEGTKSPEFRSLIDSVHEALDDAPSPSPQTSAPRVLHLCGGEDVLCYPLEVWEWNSWEQRQGGARVV